MINHEILGFSHQQKKQGAINYGIQSVGYTKLWFNGYLRLFLAPCDPSTNHHTFVAKDLTRVQVAASDGFLRALI